LAEDYGSYGSQRGDIFGLPNNLCVNLAPTSVIHLALLTNLKHYYIASLM